MAIYTFYSLSLFNLSLARQFSRQLFSAMILSFPLKSHQIRICILFLLFSKSFFKSSNNDNEEYFFERWVLSEKASMRRGIFYVWERETEAEENEGESSEKYNEKYQFSFNYLSEFEEKGKSQLFLPFNLSNELISNFHKFPLRLFPTNLSAFSISLTHFHSQLFNLSFVFFWY